MGDVSTPKWGLLSPGQPNLGVKLSYTHGSRCDGYTRRSTHFHFECDPLAGVGGPLAVYGDCEFVIRWRTAYACPRRPSTFLPILFWVTFSVCFYLVARFIYNIYFLKMSVDWESVPHISEIRWVGALILLVSEKLWNALQNAAPGIAERLAGLGSRSGGSNWGFGGADGGLRPVTVSSSNASM
mmetsp:Transcript_22926/g.35877  ORF Transcript_22926/g.35877 Transcript_22926/m.35877 type:complete len:184 (-) Transcript_22926:126-677(-)